MRSPSHAESGRTRSAAVSRRSLLACASAVTLPMPTAASPTIAAGAPSNVGPNESGGSFKAWLHLDDKIERLQTRWAQLESWLIREHRWCELSPAEQLALPWSRELRDIDGCLDLLFERREALLERMPAAAAENVPELAARLAVAARLVSVDEQPEAHGIITGVRLDLLRLSNQAPPW